MDANILSTATSKLEGQTEIFNIGMETNLGERKLWIQTGRRSREG